MSSSAAPPRPGNPVEAAEMTPYLWALLAMLVSATIFDGFDAAILSAVGPIIQKQHQLTHTQWGLIHSIVRIGAVSSFFLLVFADRYGRRPLITLTIVGYAFFTGLTALSWDIVSFTFFQFCARIFLAGEFALALIIIGEEYPTRWRSIGIALLSGISAVGTVAAFGSARYVLVHYDWRAMYFLGLLPLGLVFFFRLGIRETRRFEQTRGEASAPSWRTTLSNVRIPFQRRFRRRALLVTLIWNCTHVLTAPAVAFWTIHAARNLGHSPDQYGFVVQWGYTIGPLIGAPLAGLLMNSIGRKFTCAIFYMCAALAIFVLFRHDDPSVPVQTALMAVSIGFFLGAHAATSTYATELFPTEIRALGYGWTTNLFGRATEIATPLLIGVLADRIGIPAAVGIAAIGPVIGAVVVLVYAPETSGKTLEEIDDALTAE